MASSPTERSSPAASRGGRGATGYRRFQRAPSDESKLKCTTASWPTEAELAAETWHVLHVVYLSRLLTQKVTIFAAAVIALLRFSAHQKGAVKQRVRIHALLGNAGEAEVP